MALQKLWQTLDGARLTGRWGAAADALSETVSLLFPTACVVCEEPDFSLCARCARDLRKMTVRPFRAEAAAEGLPGAESRPTKYGTVREPNLNNGSGAGFDPLPVIAAGTYSRALASALLAFKNHGHTDVQRWLQAALAGALHEACSSLNRPGAVVVLVPIPPKGSSVRRRGYDPLSLLLRGLERRGELPQGSMVVPAVRHRAGGRMAGRQGAGASQKGLGRRRRRSNVVGSMEAAPDYLALMRGRTCLIVDDVLTTGATIAEATRVLRDVGATVAGAVVIAATAPPRTRRASGS